MARVVEEMASKIEETAASCGDVDLGEDWLNPLQGPDRPKLHVFLNDRDGRLSAKLIYLAERRLLHRALFALSYQTFLKRFAFSPFATLLKLCGEPKPVGAS